jgi:predicted AAA+ superfamily ATPase
MYFNDIGFLNMLLNFQGFDLIKWKLVENFIFNQLNANLNKNIFNLYFYRTWGGNEIDFIVKNNLTGKIYPIEVKSWDKDNLWKWLINFIKAYKDDIEEVFITTQQLLKTRIENWIKINFIPYVLVHNVVKQILKFRVN